MMGVLRTRFLPIEKRDMEALLSMCGGRVRQGLFSGVYCTPANKRLVLTPPARNSFGIIARHKGLGGNFSVFLPHRAREAQHNRGVRPFSIS